VPHDGKPVLERSDRVHVSQPRTPPVTDQSESVVDIVHAKHRGEEEEGLELDLESLGLEDKEIPPEKLTKLEKIGSGGFKE
jgi:mitogen-activated protein kinase kinase kinase 13